MKFKRKQLYDKSKSQGKRQRAYIACKEDEDSSSYFSSSYEEVANFHLMARHRPKDLNVSDFNFHSLPCYNELFEVFHEMHVDALKDFMKTSIKK